MTAQDVLSVTRQDQDERMQRHAKSVVEAVREVCALPKRTEIQERCILWDCYDLLRARTHLHPLACGCSECVATRSLFEVL